MWWCDVCWGFPWFAVLTAARLFGDRCWQQVFGIKSSTKCSVKSRSLTISLAERDGAPSSKRRLNLPSTTILPSIGVIEMQDAMIAVLCLLPIAMLYLGEAELSTQPTPNQHWLRYYTKSTVSSNIVDSLRPQPRIWGVAMDFPCGCLWVAGWVKGKQTGALFLVRSSPSLQIHYLLTYCVSLPAANVTTV